jgi:hypothetical protein
VQEYRQLALAVIWVPSADDTVIEKITAAAIFAVAAEDTDCGDTIGCTLLLGANISFTISKI